MTEVLVPCAILVALSMTITWAISLRARDASIVDPAWGLNVLLVAVLAYWIGDPQGARGAMLLAVSVVYGMRLFLHLSFRKEREPGEDRRYARWREKLPWFPVSSLVLIFYGQGVVLLLVTVPILLTMSDETQPPLGVVGIVGLAIWCVGFAFEAIADAQLAHFLAEPANRGQVMDRGLWRYSRHPNYFGEACMWWGVFVLSLGVDQAILGLVSPVLMTFLLLRVSGVRLLEKDIGSRRPGYAEYTRRTSAFFPLPPKDR